MSSPIDTILSQLDKVKSFGNGKYKALCPVHNEKTPSLAITERDDGSILAHCFGCGANGIEIVQALGLQPSDLYPKSQRWHNEKYRQPFPAKQILECIGFESQIVLIAAQQVLGGHSLNKTDFERLRLANDRIYSAVNYGKQK